MRKYNQITSNTLKHAIHAADKIHFTRTNGFTEHLRLYILSNALLKRTGILDVNCE
jgi:hypothetical protein